MANLCRDALLRSLLIIRMIHYGEKVGCTETAQHLGSKRMQQGGKAREKASQIRENGDLPQRNRVGRRRDRVGAEPRRGRTELREPGNQPPIWAERQFSDKVSDSAPSRRRLLLPMSVTAG